MKQKYLSSSCYLGLACMNAILQSPNFLQSQKTIWSGRKTSSKLTLQHPTVASFRGSCWQRYPRQKRDKNIIRPHGPFVKRVPPLPEKNIAQLHEAPAVSFARCFSEWHRWMSFGENNAICPPFHGISSLFFPFCAGILSIRRRFFTRRHSS